MIKKGYILLHYIKSISGDGLLTLKVFLEMAIIDECIRNIEHKNYSVYISKMQETKSLLQMSLWITKYCHY